MLLIKTSQIFLMEGNTRAYIIQTFGIVRIKCLYCVSKSDAVRTVNYISLSKHSRDKTERKT